MKTQFEFLLAMTFLATFIHRSTSSSSHLVQVINNCNSPTSIQIPGQGNFTSPISKTFQGDINGGIAQACSNINGNGCTSVEFELTDGTSSADITLIPPHKFDHPATFTLNNGQTGATCDNANCGPENAAYNVNGGSEAIRTVQGPNSSIKIQFC